MYVHVCACISHVFGCLGKPDRFLGAGITGSWELLGMGLRNWIQVPWKSNKFSWLPSSLFIPNLSLSLFKRFIYICVSVSVFTTCVQLWQKPGEGIGFLGASVTNVMEFVSILRWVLGLQPKSPGRAASTPNHWKALSRFIVKSQIKLFLLFSIYTSVSYTQNELTNVKIALDAFAKWQGLCFLTQWRVKVRKGRLVRSNGIIPF